MSINRLSARALRRIVRRARPYLEPDEVVQKAAYGLQGGVRRMLLVPVALLGSRWARYVIVAATQRNIYVFRRGRVLVPGIKGVMAKCPLGSVPVSYGGHELWVGQESYYTGMLSKDGEEVAEIAGV